MHKALFHCKSLFFCLLLSSLTLSAQHNQYSNYVYDNNAQTISLNFENDTYYYTDYYYTYGLETTYFNNKLSKNAPGSIILPKFSRVSGTTAGFIVAQRLYTPKNIRDSLIQVNDRPFAATFEIDYKKISNDLKFRNRNSKHCSDGYYLSSCRS
jgi:Outer membrane protein LpxR